VLRKYPIALLLLANVQHAAAETAETASPAIEQVNVLGVAPVNGVLNTHRLPYAVQSFDRDDLQQSGAYSIAELLASRASSVSFNAAQGNRLQTDLRFRGYTASPLLGLPQGVAVYQNGVRVNEVFGDSVNWDLLPTGSVDTMHLVAGANPVYGLNALGGALVLSSKTGFSAPESTLSIAAGSYQTTELEISSGANNGEWGYFVSFEGMDEQGWRDYSASQARNLYSALSWRGERRQVDVFFNAADTRLRGNGTVPVALLEQQREAVFTHPDITDNQLAQLSASLRQQTSQHSELSVNLFYRQSHTDSFNGDGSEFEACDDVVNDGFLCDEEDDALVQDQYGDAVQASLNAINNRSRRDQYSTGLTVQWLGSAEGWGLSQQWLVGADYHYGYTDFESSVEFAALTNTRGTLGSGLYDDEAATSLSARSRTAALYVSDEITLTEQLSLTLSARYNNSQIDNRDTSGERPELYGSHGYRRLNGGVGVVYQWTEMLALYATAQQSSRTPTPVELSCSHPEAPCNLPNSFLADPPLDDVVSRSMELGLRGQSDVFDQWRLGVFHGTNRDDILFQTTGGVSSNQGFFTNSVDTVRQGIELDLSTSSERWQWYFNYTFLQASYDGKFVSSSANHPQAVDGKLLVKSGSRLPTLPAHSAKMGLQYQLTPRWQLSLETLANSGQYLRGDEANRDDKTAGYGLLNISSRYQLSDAIALRFKVDNVFDKHYESFGLYGEADEVLEDLEDDSGRFLGPGSPRQYWLSIAIRW
jgi:outer membrane receptor protein involved in Fe transport